MPFCLAKFASIDRIIYSHCPPKGDFMDMLSSDCQANLIPLLRSYSFNNLIYIFLKMPNWTHSWNRLWDVWPEPNSEGAIFHKHPLVLRTYRILSITFLNWTIRRPTVLFGFSVGNAALMIFYRLSKIFVMVGVFSFLCRLREDTLS